MDLEQKVYRKIFKLYLFSTLMGLVALFGCAAFTYRYYGLAEVIYEHGTLLGPKASDDLPFSKCAPNTENKHPCVVIFTKEFFAFKQDYEDTKQKLVECQKQ